MSTLSTLPEDMVRFGKGFMGVQTAVSAMNVKRQGMGGHNEAYGQ